MISHDSVREAANPVDLEIRVTTPWGSGGQRLHYILHSPSGVVPFYQEPVQGPSLQEPPEEFRRKLLRQLEKLEGHKDVDGGVLVAGEIQRELTTLGHDLFRELFSRDLQRIYRSVADQVKTLIITSDEPWIPWEMLRPFGEEGDDFFCMRFQMGRWLTGEVPLASSKRVSTIVGVEAGGDSGLREARSEIRNLQNFASNISGLDGRFLSTSLFSEVIEELDSGDFDIFHFAGHGEYAESQPKESKISLEDRGLRARQLSPETEHRLRHERPVVFFNSCQVGQLGHSLTGLDGWAPRWVRRCGCTAFLAPLWSVRDGSAREFAENFYRELVAGRTLGEAVLVARHALRVKDPRGLSCLAYSFYGNPNARILFEEGTSPTAPAQLPLVPPADVASDRAANSREGSVDASKRRVSKVTRRDLQGHNRDSHSPISRNWLFGTAGIAAATLFLVQTQPWGGEISSEREPNPTGLESTPALQDPSLEVDRNTLPSESEQFDSRATDHTTRPTRVKEAASPEHLGEAKLSLPKSREPSPPPPKPKPAIPLEPLVSGRVGIVVLDSDTGRPNSEISQAIASLVFNLETGLQPLIPRIEDIGYLDALARGDLSRLPGGEQSPWGSEYLLVATSNLTRRTKRNPPLEGLTLSLDAKLITLREGAIELAVNQTHTGLGPSLQVALAQAADRCLENVLNKLKGDPDETS